MKNRFFLYTYITLFTAALAGTLTGCDTEDVDPILAPAVDISKVITTSSSEVTIVFKPNAAAGKFVYAIGDETDRASFTDGSLPGIKEAEINEEQTVVFTDLDQNSVYTIFARAYNANGTAGPVASVKAKTRKPLQEFVAAQQYVTDQAAAITIESTTEYYKYMFALGKEGDRVNFEERVLENIVTKEEISTYTANYFGLDANTDYVFYIQGYDRLSDEPSETREIKFTTAARGSVPSVSFRIDHIDIFSGQYTFTPNEHCGKIAVTLSIKDTYADVIENQLYWKGDIMRMLSYWTDGNNGLTTIGYEGPLQAKLLTSDLLVDETLGAFNHPLEAYVLLYDKEGKPFGVQHIEFQTPSYDDKAGKAEVELKISDIYSNGAFYEFFPNQYTMGIVYQTFDAEWYENLLRSPEYYDGYIENFLFEKGYWNYCYKVTSSTMPEKTAEPGKRYYVFYMPMNYNGPFGGWGDLKLQMFQTPAK